MNPENNGSATPVVAPPAPAAPAAPAPAVTPPAPSTPPVTTPPAPATPPPAEGQQPPASTPPAQPAAPAAATPPEPPRESAQQRRARELREKSSGYNRLADKLDPPATPAQPAAPVIAAPQPTPPAPNAPAQPVTSNYYDPDTGLIDPVALDQHIENRARALAGQTIQEREAQASVYQARETYVTTVESDAAYLASNVPELTPGSAQYDAGLDDYIERRYREATTDAQGNVIRTDLSLRKFAEDEVAEMRKRVEAAKATVPNAVAGQSADTAVVPGAGQAPAEPDINKLPLKERHAARAKKLGFYQPPKR